MIAGLIAAVWVVLLVLCLSPCSCQGWMVLLCMAASEPVLPLGATFAGINQTNHRTGRRAGPWKRILVVVIIVFLTFKLELFNCCGFTG